MVISTLFDLLGPVAGPAAVGGLALSIGAATRYAIDVRRAREDLAADARHVDRLRDTIGIEPEAARRRARIQGLGPALTDLDRPDRAAAAAVCEELPALRGARASRVLVDALVDQLPGFGMLFTFVGMARALVAIGGADAASLEGSTFVADMGLAVVSSALALGLSLALGVLRRAWNADEALGHVVDAVVGLRRAARESDARRSADREAREAPPVARGPRWEEVACHA